MATNVIKAGFNAGDGYSEVWIRDYNTFITLATKVHPMIRSKISWAYFLNCRVPMAISLMALSKIQPKEWCFRLLYNHESLAAEYAGHKNTVETDQKHP
ncbi:hypothetical protein KUH03_35825 [Sphingobacterium sp. E70]|uniref:hypothetical protein n=1 Tax=Sphingobacterium sp. E70 TaxID=2853439 RepID=UPI00211CB8F9|nr:hypothetical protein [Sphingobacterium sp. E70]ULT24333.1 hypothetical protein KUH03_35825 [Sphingobacterium sp. E70]